MSVVVIDTNVVLVANGQHQDVSESCVAACALRLEAVMKSGKLALDDRFQILSEYQNKTKPKIGNRPGDAFVKWALRNNANPTRVDAIAIEDHKVRGYESFPDDPTLATFDPPDRKFVAVANAHPKKPSILQAADSKWLDWEASLGKHALTIVFVCPDDIKGFHDNKFRP
jgi:hypothetical protein